MMHRSLSEKQRDILLAIHRFEIFNGLPLTFREVVSGADLSSTAVAKYQIELLEQRGLVTHSRLLNRTIRLSEMGRRYVRRYGLVTA